MSATVVSGTSAYNSKDKRAVPVKLYALSHDNKIIIIIIIIIIVIMNNTSNTYYAFQLMMNIHMYCV